MSGWLCREFYKLANSETKLADAANKYLSGDIDAFRIHLSAVDQVARLQDLKSSGRWREVLRPVIDG